MTELREWQDLINYDTRVERMTKDQAIKAMLNGEKVTHRNFTPEEWMKHTDHLYEFEDGCLCSYNEFWQFRDDESWLEGWKIYSKPLPNNQQDNKGGL